MRFYPLQVSKIIKETEDATSLYFDIPSEWKEQFSYHPGQYLTLKFNIDGEEYRRAYSICTAPFEPNIGVTSKKIFQGKVSGYIHDHVKQGTQVEVMPPAGKFGFSPEQEDMRDIYMFAAGSGITPIFSIIKTILEESPKSRCHILYGNRNQDSIIYRDALNELEARYTDQIHIVHTLSSPKEDKGISSIFKKTKTKWQGWKGRINANSVKRFLKEFESRTNQQVYLICGPGSMIETVKGYLLEEGIDKQLIQTEHYINEASDTEQKEALPAGGVSRVKVNLDGQLIEIDVPPDKTILETLLSLKYDPPYSCTSGACSTCVAKIISGKVEMDVCYALDDDEVEEGFILTCQSHPTTPELEIIYES